MAIPGYDLDDLDDNLQARIDEQDVEEYLTDEELQRLQGGESLLDLLDEDDLDRLIAGKPRPEE
ncbi:hypothetical protein BRC81_10135 [Halobacteriales archaeon QS_1_68_20]|nr:MAG: hypothetical protein BRC81_10135 [Halobacteriales archaeon QS_1_68_20]